MVRTPNLNMAFKPFIQNRRGQAFGWWTLFLTICITLSIFTVYLIGVDPYLSFPLTSRTYQNATIPTYFSYENITAVASSQRFTIWDNGSIDQTFGQVPNRIFLSWKRFPTLPAFMYMHHDTDVLPLLNIVWGWHELTHSPPYIGDHSGYNFLLTFQTNPTYGMRSSLVREEMVTAFVGSKGYSYFVWKCDHFTVYTFFFPYNTTKTLEESWDMGKMQMTFAYGMNFTASSISVWSIIGQILTFQIPELGLGTGLAGYIITSLISIPLWFSLIFIAYKLICGIIPFISGGE